MSIYRDKAHRRLIFEFDHYIGGRRVRARKVLPRAWSQAQADAFDRRESARLYDLATGASSNDSIDAAVACYLSHRVPALKHGRGIAAELALITWVYTGRTLAELAEVCRKYADHERARLAPATIKNRIRYLVAACRYAWRHHGMGRLDPGARVATPAVDNARHEYVDRADMLRLARACPQRQARAAIRIAFYSGMRLDEIRRAERDLVRQRFVLRDTKNGEPRIVPMHPRLRVLARYAMPSRFTINTWWRVAREARGMEHLHFHDLRHSAASAMIAQGIDLYTVGAVLGHKSHASTQRYAHHAVGQLTEAVNRIGQKVPQRLPAQRAA